VGPVQAYEIVPRPPEEELVKFIAPPTEAGELFDAEREKEAFGTHIL